MNRNGALVIGGGVGGLACALFLARNGIAVTLVERAHQLSDVGAGLQLSPNATRLLHALGLEDALRRVAFKPEAIDVRTARHGIVLNRVPLGDAVAKKFGAPYYHIHRADLVDSLAQAAQSHPLITLRLAAECTACETGAKSARALIDGKWEAADFLIGADGIRSNVREALFGPENPGFTGHVAWRGLVPATAFIKQHIPPVAGLWLGDGAHFVHYYVRSGELLNFVAIVERDDWQVESWLERGDKAELKASFAAWHPQVQAIIEQANPDSLFRWALFDRAPMAEWSKGCATLVGDACHATLPFMAQGACMAIEDGAVLAECVAGQSLSELPKALERYATLRQPRTRQIQLGSRRNGVIHHLRPPASWLRNLRMRFGPALNAQADALYHYDAFAAATTAQETY